MSERPTAGQPRKLVLVIAGPGCGAEALLDGLSETKRFYYLSGDCFPVAGFCGILRHYSEAPKPGLHFLADFPDLLISTRRLADAITETLAAPPAVGANDPPRAIVLYSEASVHNISELRLLYPEALHLHLVRNISAGLLENARDSGHPAWQLCGQWRAAQRAVLDLPPWPRQITVRYEDLMADTVATVNAITSLLQISLDDDEQKAFAEVFLNPEKAMGEDRERGRNGTARYFPFVRRLVSRAAAVCCDAELAAFRYRKTLCAPGRLRKLIAEAVLRLAPALRVDDRRIH